jgi:hypothetical protein
MTDFKHKFCAECEKWYPKNNDACPKCGLADVVRSTAPLLIKGRYNEELNYVDENGNQLCEWCESDNITDPVPGAMNGICNECGSHW